MTFFGRRLLSCGDLIENRTRVSVHFDEARTSRHSRLTRKFVEFARVIGQTHRDDETVASYVTREFCATGIRISFTLDESTCFAFEIRSLCERQLQEVLLSRGKAM